VNPLDITTVSLEPGVTLIEASAGTGKTYSITGLVLRLIVERHLKIREILAVTFTEAATQELRERIRRRLQGALEDLRGGTSGDPVVRTFLANGDLSLATRELEVALQSFDEAQVFTIHGFCQRMLNDYAFESGVLFESAVLIDPNPLFQEVARDFWRMRFYEAKPLLPTLTMAWQRSPDNWVALLEQTRRHPDLVVLPATESKSCDELLRKVETAFSALIQEWNDHGPDVKDLLRTHNSLSREEKKFRHDRVEELLIGIAEACSRPGAGAAESIRAFAEVSLEALAGGTKANRPVPTHRFFNLSTDFSQKVDALFNQLARDFLIFAEVELAKRKARANTVTYDDLISGLLDALRREKSKVLAKAIGEQYSAALIDEFQDTDPTQYEIFQTLFRSKNHCLFFIGDPKQAIYGFRGADVFTYFEAAGIADRRLTLVTNWRSEENLLRAINGLFSQVETPFVLSEIQYYEVHATSEPVVERLIGPGHITPLNFRLIKPMEGRADRERPSVLISRALTHDIAALQQSGALLGTRPVRYGDMAVLVRRYGQAEEIQIALREQGIRSIVHSDQNVFASLEARELQQFLQGVIDPRRDPLLKAALATTLIGFNAQRLFEFDRNDQKRQVWLDRFSNWRQQWANGCFMAMFRHLVVSQNVRARLIALPAGERRLTNFLHLAELLHDAERARSLTPDALCVWLREQRESERVSQDQFQLRLESDEDAVQIVTIHKSKGLEYPIVFCPFLWQRAELQRQEELLFHDRDSANRLTFDLRGRKAGLEKHRLWQSEETRAEELRLLYVAVSRAKNRCYIYLPDQKIDKSPLAQLFQPTGGSLGDQVDKLAKSSKGCIDVSSPQLGERGDVLPCIQGLTAASPPADREAGLTLKPRPFAGRISKLAMTASFSGLNIADVDLDEGGSATPVELSPATASPLEDTDLSIFTFDRGRRTGDFFHDVLERMDFQNLETLSDLVESRLGVHGFARTLHRLAIIQLLRELTEIQLEPGIRLQDIPKRERISECEFYYPLPRLTPAGLAKTVGQWQTVEEEIRTRMGKLRFDPIEGYMHGFIDLLFQFKHRYYLVDWKSNWLGSEASNYGREAMHQAMLKHNYYLQYHLYTLAADLFLERRLPGYSYQTHFGGVFYIFLRGLDPLDPSRGIFRDRPAEETVAGLRRLIS
jgi:exodeoxyribonuclease V beta subunit